MQDAPSRSPSPTVSLPPLPSSPSRSSTPSTMSLARNDDDVFEFTEEQSTDTPQLGVCVGGYFSEARGVTINPSDPAGVGMIIHVDVYQLRALYADNIDADEVDLYNFIRDRSATYVSVPRDTPGAQYVKWTSITYVKSIFEGAMENSLRRSIRRTCALGAEDFPLTNVVRRVILGVYVQYEVRAWVLPRPTLGEL